MKALNNLELQSFVQLLQPMVGMRMERFVLCEGRLYVRMFQEGGLNSGVSTFLLDTDKRTPFILLQTHASGSWPRLAKVSGARKPVELFLRAHVAGKHLLSIELLNPAERIVVFRWQGGELRFVMIPGYVNILVQGEDKALSYRKGQPPEHTPVSAEIKAFPVRSIQTLYDEYFSQKKSGVQKEEPSALSAEALMKKQRTIIQKITKDIEIKKNLPWRSVGEWLYKHQSLKVPEPWKAYVDTQESLAWNRNNCFVNAKKNQEKILKSTQRLEEVLNVLRVLEEGGVPQSPPKGSSKGIVMPVANYRTLSLPSGNKFCVGKSARDNLLLLRGGKPWHLWLHLKDIPSAHGLAFINKGEVLSEELLSLCCQFLLSCHFKQKLGSYKGEVFPVIYTSKRHVQPLKGDRNGRVIPCNIKILNHRCQ